MDLMDRNVQEKVGGGNGDIYLIVPWGKIPKGYAQ